LVFRHRLIQTILNLWLSPDHQGRYYFKSGNYDEAAKRFKDPLWKGVSYYSNENYEAAIGEFAKVNIARAKKAFLQKEKRAVLSHAGLPSFNP
jgi:tetratricopeptide (TPR) repeat protein